MTNPQSTSVPAGWYTDPSGQPGERWWDGASWSPNTRPTPPPVQQQPTFPVMPQPVEQPVFPTMPQPVQEQPVFPVMPQPVQQQPAYPAIPQAPPEVRQPGSQFAYQGVSPSISPPAYQPAQPSFQQSYQQQGAYQPMQSFAAVQPYGGGQSYGYGQAYGDVRAINPSTEYMWRIAFWPLTAVPATAAYVLLGGLTASVTRDYSAALNAAFVFFAISTLCFALSVWFAYKDSRELKMRQLPEPFGWGWAFIPIVYVIGRSVVAYSRTGRGLAPLFVYIGVWIFTNAIATPMIFVFALSASG